MSAKRIPCPACGRNPGDKTMKVTTDERGTVQFCYRCQLTTWDNHERAPDAPRDPNAAPLDWSDRAEHLWRSALPLGELAQAYLTRRGCALPPRDGDLRFLAASDRYPPTLCARITDAVTAKPISLHLTPLLPNASGHGERRLLAGHRKRGGVIRLWPNEAITYGLGIAEGIETALAAARICTPVWACIDAGNLAALPVLAGIDCLAIYADNDDAGNRAAQACERRWQAVGREVCIYRPRRPGEDMADLMARLDAQRDAA